VPGVNRIILDLCAGTGAWSEPYVQAGYDVRRVTLPDGDVRTYVPPTHVYGILAAPPCTEFSLANQSRPRDLAGALEIVQCCLRIIQACYVRQKLHFWAMENPRALLRQILGLPAMSIEYWRFGDDLQKPTDLWGYFRRPKFTVFRKPTCLRTVTSISNWDGKAAERRAITPPGFAHAFFRANP
jgi:hypothetical protein